MLGVRPRSARFAQRDALLTASLSPTRLARICSSSASFRSGAAVRMIGDVVGGAHEAVKGQHRRTVARRDQERGDREILAPVILAGLQIGYTHASALAWTRPFHIPPLPDQCSSAD